MRYFLIILLIFLVSCASLSEKIQQNINQNNFASALQLLEEKEVGTALDPDADEEALEARSIYERGVTAFYQERVNEELRLGNLRQARQFALEAFAFCPWSTEIQNTKSELELKLQELTALQKKWQHQLHRDITLSVAKDIATDIKSNYDFIHDSPRLIKLYDKATKRIMDQWAADLRKHGKNFDQNAVADFFRDLDNFPNLLGEKKGIISAYNNYIALPQKKKNTHKGVTFETKSYEAIVSIGKFLKSSNDYSLLLSNRNHINELFQGWIYSTLVPALKNKSVSYQLVDAAEQILLDLKITETKYKSGLANAHLARAKKRASDGKSAAVSLLHIQRASMLQNGIEATQKSKSIQRLATASLQKTNPVKASVSIGGSPNIDPTVYSLLRNMFASRINSDTKSYFRWIWKNPDTERSEIEVYLTGAHAFSPSISDLSTINSQYLSHYENVPNPQKEILASQLQWADSQVDSAKWAYDSAVSSHNMYPTQTSLMSANNAYTTYKMAVDNYNSILNQYKYAPATISQAVYLPYTFQQGNIMSGWDVAATISVNGKAAETFSMRLVDTDFVRLGANPNDRTSEYRRNDGIDIDTSDEVMFSKLDQLLESLTSKFKSASRGVSYETFPRAEMEEQAVLTALYQPFGPIMPTAASPWVRDAYSNFNLPSTTAVPLRRVLRRSSSGTATGTNIKQFISEKEALVCEIRDELGHGTGTLISRDGLILTCAHVLGGGAISAIFHSGKTKGQYACDPVFIDEKNDVALIKAKGLKSSKWANVRLSKKPIKGEKIVAIGNPAIDVGATVTAGATQGIVSNPDIQFHGTHRMAGDITIASGSSGGPIFSLESGELVAVVTAVGSAGLSQKVGGVSSSGYFCLGAPSTHLKKWLGLTY